MDPMTTSAIVELATDPKVLGAAVALVSTVIGATERIGGERFKIIRRVWRAIQGNGAALIAVAALGLGCQTAAGGERVVDRSDCIATAKAAHTAAITACTQFTADESDDRAICLAGADTAQATAVLICVTAANEVASNGD